MSSGSSSYQHGLHYVSRKMFSDNLAEPRENGGNNIITLKFAGSEKHCTYRPPKYTDLTNYIWGTSVHHSASQSWTVEAFDHAEVTHGEACAIVQCKTDKLSYENITVWNTAIPVWDCGINEPLHVRFCWNWCSACAMYGTVLNGIILEVGLHNHPVH